MAEKLARVQLEEVEWETMFRMDDTHHLRVHVLSTNLPLESRVMQIMSDVSIAQTTRMLRCVDSLCRLHTAVFCNSEVRVQGETLRGNKSIRPRNFYCGSCPIQTCMT